MKQAFTLLLILSFSVMVLVGCMHELKTRTIKSKTYSASYDLSLNKVERPEKATQRYGSQKVDTVSNNSKYRFVFEDDLVRIFWLADSRNIAFSLENKTDHSIKLLWDEAAFVDENGRSHRVMHSGVKYNDKEKSQAPSIVVRKGSLEDIVFPTDYVSWLDGGGYMAGSWIEKPFFPSSDYYSGYGKYSTGKYASFASFDSTVKSYVGKTYQVLLPLQIEDVINDYIFTFKVDDVTAKQDSSSHTGY